MTTTAALFSTEVEFEALKKHPEFSNVILIALTPEADYTLRKNKQPGKNIEELIDYSHLAMEGCKNFEKVDGIIDILRQVHQEDPIMGKILSASAHYHAFKTFYDRFWYYSMIAKTITSTYDKILFFKENQVDSIEDPRNINILTTILNFLADHNKIEYLEICDSPKIKIKAKRNKRGLLYFLNLFKSFVSNKIELHIPFKKKTLIDSRIDWHMFIKLKENVGQKRPTARLKRRQDFSFNNKEQVIRDRLKDGFIFHGIDLSEIMIPQVLKFIDYCKYECKAYYLFWLRKLKKSDIQKVVSLVPSTSDEIGFWLAAKHLGISYIIPQHGGFIGYVTFPMDEYMEKKSASQIVAYGEGCRQAFNPTPTIIAGSPSCYKIYQSRQEKDVKHPKKKVLIVSDALQTSTFYFSWHIKPAIETYRLHQRIIELIEKNAEIYLKLYPGQQNVNPVYSWIEENKIKINDLTDIPLETVLLNQQFDLIITDGPATTLLQVVSTNIPIIAYFDDRYYRFKPEALKLLEKRAVVIKDRDLFLNHLKSIVEKGFLHLEGGQPVDDSFLIAYGLKNLHISPVKEWVKIMDHHNSEAMAQKTLYSNLSKG